MVSCFGWIPVPPPSTDSPILVLGKHCGLGSEAFYQKLVIQQVLAQVSTRSQCFSTPPLIVRQVLEEKTQGKAKEQEIGYRDGGSEATRDCKESARY
jgi:hypothetical protein